MTRTEAEALAASALPCPFCGERLEVEAIDDDKTFILDHPVVAECPITCEGRCFTKQALDRWNRRTPKEQ